MTQPDSRLAQTPAAQTSGTGHATATLIAWEPPDMHQRALREAFLGLLAAREDACLRSCLPGHLTASTLVLDPTGSATCLVHHRIVGAWLAPGGHLETGETLAQAALREAREETGLDGLQLDPVPLTLDCHPITCRGSLGPTRHYDVRFLATAPKADPVTSEESSDVRWFSLDELPEVFDEVHELVRLASARLAQRRAQPLQSTVPTG